MKGLMDRHPVTEAINCDVAWNSKDAGSTLGKEEIMETWKNPSLRPCGLMHMVIDKRWCAYKCHHNQNKKASG